MPELPPTGRLPLSEYPLGQKKLDPGPPAATTGDIFELVDLVRACMAAGFVTNRGLIIAVAVSCGEDSRHSLTAVYTNTGGTRPGSKDRGPFQFNDYFHAEVTDECAFNLECSARAAFRVSEQGMNFTPWSAFNNGAYKVHMEAAWTAYALVTSNDRNKYLVDNNNALSAKNATLSGQVAEITSQKATVQSQLDAALANISTLDNRIARAREILSGG